MLWLAYFAYIWDCLAIMGLPPLVLSLHQANYKLKHLAELRGWSWSFLSLEMPIALQWLIPKVRGKHTGAKQPGTKVVTLAFEKSASLKLTDSQLPGNKSLSYIQRFSLGFSRSPEQFKILERNAL